ncbi:hypothetical protein GGI05_000908, partial [Coemansia sp. RSA 2603]
MGARLTRHAAAWRSMTQSSWVHNVVESGYRLQFQSKPVQRVHLSSAHSPEETLAIRMILATQLEEGIA